MNFYLKSLTITALAAGACAVIVTSASAEEGRKRDGKRGINFEQMDTNGDGFITAAEIEAGRAARFASADTDGDGALSADELKAAHAARAAEKGREMRAEKSDKRLARKMKKMDANKDGKISQSEMQKRSTSEIIERLDTDKDGKISKAEAEAAKGKRKGKRENDTNNG